jgi:hypothetical protein
LIDPLDVSPQHGQRYECAEVHARLLPVDQRGRGMIRPPSPKRQDERRGEKNKEQNLEPCAIPRLRQQVLLSFLFAIANLLQKISIQFVQPSPPTRSRFRTGAAAELRAWIR